MLSMNEEDWGDTDVGLGVKPMELLAKDPGDQVIRAHDRWSMALVGMKMLPPVSMMAPLDLKIEPDVIKMLLLTC
jgi:hypothetical protein